MPNSEGLTPKESTLQTNLKGLTVFQGIKEVYKKTGLSLVSLATWGATTAAAVNSIDRLASLQHAPSGEIAIGFAVISAIAALGSAIALVRNFRSETNTFNQLANKSR